MTSEFVEILGGCTLKGSVRVSGAKNAVLPMLIGSLLTADEVCYTNVPQIRDVGLTIHLLEHFGGHVSYSDEELRVRVPQLRATEASYSLVKAMRASFWVLGPLLARGGAARVALPGGDIIGARPVDLHLQALTEMGAEIKVRHGVVFATAPEGLKPATINFRFPSVGATHQVMLAAARTPGTTVIRGAAREPEVVALARMLNDMGAQIHGAGNDEVVISGQEYLTGAKVQVIGDRIEAATYIFAAMATGGQIRVEGVSPDFFGDFLETLPLIGGEFEFEEDAIVVNAVGALNPLHIATGPFPKLATDMQAPLMALMCCIPGESRIEESIFEGRFSHVAELCRMGADIRVEGQTAIINGGKPLSGAPVEAMDIRGAVSLVIAALTAEGTTQLFEPIHLRRGYAHLESKLRGLGADIGLRVQNPEDFLFSGC